MDLYEIKNFLKIDEDITEDDVLVDSLITAAKQYIEGCTGKEYSNTDKLYGLAVMLLVGNWYENRQSVSDKEKKDVPQSLTAIIAHLNWSSGNKNLSKAVDTND